MNQDLNQLAARVHEANHKWWHDIHSGEPLKRNKGELLMLVVTELAEAVEGIRKDMMDDKLTHRKMEEVEMADAVIRILDFAGGFKVQFLGREYRSEYWPAMPKNKCEAILCIVWMVAEADDPLEEHPIDLLERTIYWIDSYCKMHNLDLWGAVEEKIEFNKTRADHTHEARRKEGGKKF